METENSSKMNKDQHQEIISSEFRLENTTKHILAAHRHTNNIVHRNSSPQSSPESFSSKHIENPILILHGSRADNTKESNIETIHRKEVYQQTKNMKSKVLIRKLNINSNFIRKEFSENIKIKRLLPKDEKTGLFENYYNKEPRKVDLDKKIMSIFKDDKTENKKMLNIKRMREQLLMRNIRKSSSKIIDLKPANLTNAQEKNFNKNLISLQKEDNYSNESSASSINESNNFQIDHEKSNKNIDQDNIALLNGKGYNELCNEIKEIFSSKPKNLDWKKLFNLVNLSEEDKNSLKNCILFKKYAYEKVQFIELCNNKSNLGLFFKIDPFKKKFYLTSKYLKEKNVQVEQRNNF